jgi:hypothetical protein
MLYRETVAVYCENYVERMNIFYGRNTALLNLNANDVVRTVAAYLQRIHTAERMSLPHSQMFLQVCYQHSSSHDGGP